jgi:type IV secretory pathway TraG/TraD family ATPase VirD4
MLMETMILVFTNLFIKSFVLTLQLLWKLTVLMGKSIALLLKAIVVRLLNSPSDVSIVRPGDRPRARGGDFQDYAGVARERELSTSSVGVSLGRYFDPSGRIGRPLFLNPRDLYRHCAVIGPAGSGKTHSIINPWVLELLQQGSSVVTVDVKGELMNTLGRRAEAMGMRVWCWDSSQPRYSQSWNWLAEINEEQDIEAALRSILGKGSTGEHRYFEERDYRWLRALLKIVRQVYAHHARPQDLYRLIGDQSALHDLLSRRPETHIYQSEINDLLRYSLDEYSRAVSGLMNKLYLFNTETVINISERSDFRLSDLNSQPTLLIVGASLAGGQTSEVLSSLMLNFLFNLAFRRFNHVYSSNIGSLYFLIDEAPRLKERIDYENVLSVVRSANVGICLALQDIAQFGDEQQVSAILANCSTLITMRGCSARTAKYFSQRLGNRNQQAVSRTKEDNPFELFPSTSENFGNSEVSVLTERAIMYPPGGPHTAVVHNSSIFAKPFLVNLTR